MKKKRRKRNVKLFAESFLWID